MYHKISMIGRVGRDPEMKTVKGGLQLSSFSIAVDIHGKAKDQKVTIWPKVTVFDTAADFVKEHVKKGDLVLVEGRLSPDPATGTPKLYQKKNGSYGSSYDIVGEKVQLLSSKNRQRNNAEPLAQGIPEDIPF
ncbi:MAG: single-stranded DNA-binding protein [Anaerolineaceae bacterium]|nr:single-stranded DNA-binding protein [Anaerolineaceae bacterium]